MKKLLGKNNIQDALKKLDTLTMEEARMAIAETLKVTNRVDDKVDKVDDTVNRVDDKVDKVDDKVDKVDDKVDRVDDKVDRVDDKVDEVDNKVMVLIDGGESFSDNLRTLNKDMTANERSANTELRENLQKWLSPPDPSTNHNIARKAHHKGTASWFFQGGIFKQWKSSPLLWIHGKRMFLYFLITPHPIHAHICSGLRQKHPVVCHFLLLLPAFTQIIAQLWDN
jgi:archaellum component FlaC